MAFWFDISGHVMTLYETRTSIFVREDHIWTAVTYIQHFHIIAIFPGIKEMLIKSVPFLLIQIVKPIYIIFCLD